MSEHDEDLHALASLVRTTRWAALATVGEEDGPLASWVAYAPEPDLQGVVLHLSRLALHTRNLLETPRASLGISSADPGTGDPQALARVSLQGRVEIITPHDPSYAAARTLYLTRLPDAKPLFAFADFQLLRLVIERARFVGGFALARTFLAADLAQVNALT
jgi:hypothetical protein